MYLAQHPTTENRGRNQYDSLKREAKTRDIRPTLEIKKKVTDVEVLLESNLATLIERYYLTTSQPSREAPGILSRTFPTLAEASTLPRLTKNHRIAAVISAISAAVPTSLHFINLVEEDLPIVT